MKKQKNTMQYLGQEHGLIFPDMENVSGALSISIFSMTTPKGKYFLFND